MLGVLRCLIAIAIFVFGFGLTVFAQGVSFIASNTDNNNSAALTVSVPGQRQAGDLLIAVFTSKNAPSISGVTAGWASVDGGLSSGGSSITYVYYKFSDGTETTVGATLDAGNRWVSSCLVYRNVSAINLNIFTINTGSGTNLVANGLTPDKDSTTIVTIFGTARTANSTLTFSNVPPSGMATRTSVTRNDGGPNKVGHYISDQLIPNTSPTGNRQVSLTDITSQSWGTYMLVLEPVVASIPDPSDEILYSYQSGNWNAPLSWTRDPSGTTLIPEDGILPVTGDSVVILNGRIITATADITTEGLGIRINGGGTLNLVTFQFTNALRALSGTGRMRSSRTIGGVTYMPTVTGGQNRFILQSGGTMEYYCASNVDLNTAVTTYFNLELSRTVSGAVTYTQASNIIIYNNLILSRTGTATPTLTVGNNTTNRTLTINGSLQLAAGTNFRVGTANALHTITIGADLINNGSVRFLNITSPNYLSEPTDGRAIVTFNGLSDNKIDCFGETNFYRLILDKGSDATYILTVNSSNVNNFRLLGINNQSNNPAQNPSQANPIITKALVLNHGTLRLKENISIESLTEGGDDFWVRSTAILWVDGAEVYTTTTANGSSYQAITITGKVIVSGGLLDTRNAAGIIYTIDGVVEVRGGNMRACQMRNTGGGQTAFIQTGGTIVLDGVGENAGGTPRFQMATAASSFTMSGGLLDVRNPNNVANGGFDVNINEVNGNVTGGTVRLSTTGGTTFQFRASMPFFNLEIGRIGATASSVLQNSATTRVLNNLLIQDGQTYNCQNNNLTVGGSFTINTGTIFIPGTNTLTFNGTGRQLFTLNGGITGNLNQLTINKASDSLVLAGSAASLIVNGNFQFLAGFLNDGGKTIDLRADINMSGQHFGTGKIALTTATNRTISGNGQGRFANLDLSGPAANILYTTSAAMRISGELNFIINGSNRRILDIGANAITLDTNATVVNASAVRFIRTNGLQSAGGLTKVYNNTTFTFPVGTTDNWKYTPATISFSQAPTTYGSITVRPVNAQHPAVTENGKALLYYWRVSSAGFSLGAATVTKVFSYNDADVQATEANYVPGYIDFADIVWSVGSGSSVNAANNEVAFDGPSFNTKINGEYTAGDNATPSPFGAVAVYYSRVNGGAWNNAATWTTNPDHTTVATPATPPSGNSIVRIGNGTINHNILVTANGALSGNLVIATGSTLDLQSFTGNNFGSIAGETVAGNGLLRIGKNASATYEFPAGDFGDFLGATGGEVEYYNNTASDVTLPTVPSYKRLTFNANSSGNILLPATSLDVMDTLKIISNGAGVVRSYDVNATGGNITVGLDFRVDNGVFELACPGTSSARNIQIGRNLIIASGKSFRIQGTAAVTHNLRVQGDIVNNGTLNLRPVGADNSRATLEITSIADNKLTGTATLTRLAALTINKGAGRSAIFLVDVTGSIETLGSGWLNIQNGTFKYNNGGSLTIHDATGSVFEIIESAAISVMSGTVNMAYGNSNESDLVLRGLLEITGGTVNIGNPANTGVNNDIVIAAAGTPEVKISGGTLRVNGQIRRDLQSQAGALRYTQTGSSTVRIVGRNPNTGRGIIEVVNSGSYFEMQGNSTLIVNRGGSVNFADLYIRPDSSLVTGGTVRLTPTDMGANQSYKFDVTYSFYNLEILQDVHTATVDLNVNSLIVNNNLTVGANSTLNCNGLNVSVGRKFLKNGTYNGGSNTVRFFGNAGELEGDFTTQTIHNLTVDANATLTLVNTTSVRVNHDLRIESGATLADNGKLLDLKRNVYNFGTHSSPSNASSNTLQFTGGDVQEVFGQGTFGNVVVNNANGVYLKGPMTINRQLTLTTGLLDIGEHQLTFGVNAPAVSGTFSATRMIRTNGVLSDGGIVKNYPASNASFTWPIGVFGKYTPATINLSSNTTAGSIQIRPVNTKHPSTRDAANTQLNYFWQVDTVGFAAVTATHTYQYLVGDVTGTEASYRAGRFVFPNWTPIGGIVGAVNTTNKTINFSNVNFLGGGVTAGQESEFAAVATYYSRNATSGGNWTTLATWSTDGHDGDPATEAPEGAPVIIASGHTITVTNNSRLAESVQLNGTAILDLTNTIAHNFGVFVGTGVMRIRATAGEQFVFPGGNYEAFMAASGGTVEFYNADPGILPTQATYNKVVFKDNAVRTQPDVNYVVNGLWTIEAGSITNQLYGRNIEIRQNWENQVGAAGYVPGTGTIILNSANAQTISGVTSFYNLTISGGGSKTLNDSIAIFNELRLNSGRFYLGNHNLFMDSVSSTAGSPSLNAMVVQNGSGRIVRRVRSGQSVFTFPIGEEAGDAAYSPTTIVFTAGTFTQSASVSVQVFDQGSPECGSGANFLNRYWSWTSNGISGFTATVTAIYTNADVVGNAALINARMSQAGPCINGAKADTVLRRLTLTAAALNFFTGGEAPLDSPTISATVLVFSSVTGSSLTLSFTKGDGSGRLILVKETAAVNTVPANATTYTADADFAGNPEEIGTGNFVVYVGSDSVVTLTGLQPETEYFVAIFEFNNSGVERVYKASNPLTGSRFTLSIEPNTAAQNPSFSVIGVSNLTLNWQNGNGGKRLVLMKADQEVDAEPEDGVAYAANPLFGDGSELGTGNFVVFSGDGSTVAISNLNQNTRYFIQIFEYNGDAGSVNYYTDNAPTANQHTWLRLQLNAQLEGPYRLSDSKMFTNLSGIIPNVHPYADAPWNFTAFDSIQNLPAGNLVDWVMVEVRMAGSAANATGATVKARALAFIDENGQLIDTAGNTNGVVLPTDSNGQFYIALYHRTHIPVMSALTASPPIDQVNGAFSYNFTTAGNQAFGTDALVEVQSGVWALYAGRVENTTPFTIDQADRNATWNNRNQLGYNPSDAALEGAVDATDRSLTWNNRQRASQIPQ